MADRGGGRGGRRGAPGAPRGSAGGQQGRGGRGGRDASRERGRGADGGGRGRGQDENFRGGGRGGGRGRGDDENFRGNQGRGGFRGGGNAPSAFDGADRSSGRGRGGGGRGGGRGAFDLGNDEFTKGPGIYQSEGSNQPSGLVDRLENETVNSQTALLAKLSLSDMKIPARPGYGTIGIKEFYLRTNYFEVFVDTKRVVTKYEVKMVLRPKEARSDDGKKSKKDGKKGQKPSQVAPTETQKGKGEKQATPAPALGVRKRRVLYGCLFKDSDFKSVVKGTCIATDYASILLSSQPLNLGPDNIRTFPVAFREMEEAIQRPSPDIYDITIKRQSVVPTGELLRYLASAADDPSEFAGKADAIQALNIIVARSANEDVSIIKSGRNKYYHHPENSPIDENDLDHMSLGEALMALRGYYSSIRTSTGRVLLNVNAQCSPFYPAVEVSRLMSRYRSEIKDFSLPKLERFLQGLRVKTGYMKNPTNNSPIERVKVICGFAHADRKDRGKTVTGNAAVEFGNSNQIKFRDENGVERTIAQYFQQKYNIKIARPDLPVLNCGTFQSPVWIPPDLCLVMPGQPYGALLADTRKMLTIAARRPAENARRIVGAGLKLLGLSSNNEDHCLTQFGVRVDSRMIVVKARLLKRPLIQYPSGPVQTDQQASWNLMQGSSRFVKPAQVGTWDYIILGDSASHPKYNPNFPEQLVQQFRKLGMGNSRPKTPGGIQATGAWDKGNEVSMDQLIRPALEKVVNAPGQRPQFVIVVVPQRNIPLYGRIKYWADVKYGVSTVCLDAGKTSNKGDYWGNIALKVNLKLGGVNHSIPAPDLHPFVGTKTMIVGIDVAHPSADSIENAPSIAGVVGSVDDQFAQWPTSLRTNASKQEMVDGLASMIQERVEAYVKKNNGQCPERMLVYRDGVSEGQYNLVLEQELPRIIEGTTKAIRNKPLPKFVIIIAGKRHHTRFYPMREEDIAHGPIPRKFGDPSDPNYNPPAGTVVDRGVTMEKGHDFYLQAHHALQGTAKPTHYVIIKDEVGLGADEIQRATHALCYLYGRATKPVSLCPPAYYADLLCERGRKYLSRYLSEARDPTGKKKQYDPNESPWTSGVHPNLQNTMFYI